MTDKTVEQRLRDAAAAYPEDVFPAVTDEDREHCGSAVTRASASMGRHFSPLFTEAADRIAALTAERDAALLSADDEEKLRFVAETEFEQMYLQRGVEVDELKAIVEKLPKTADGVPVVPGDMVYKMHRDVLQGMAVKRWGNDVGVCSFTSGMNTHNLTPGDCYSTPQAAEAAHTTPTKGQR